MLLLLSPHKLAKNASNITIMPPADLPPLIRINHFISRHPKCIPKIWWVIKALVFGIVRKGIQEIKYIILPLASR
jgi:hypothetical protein